LMGLLKQHELEDFVDYQNRRIDFNRHVKDSDGEEEVMEKNVVHVEAIKLVNTEGHLDFPVPGYFKEWQGVGGVKLSDPETLNKNGEAWKVVNLSNTSRTHLVRRPIFMDYRSEAVDFGVDPVRLMHRMTAATGDSLFFRVYTENIAHSTTMHGIECPYPVKIRPTEIMVSVPTRKQKAVNPAKMSQSLKDKIIKHKEAGNFVIVKPEAAVLVAKLLGGAKGVFFEGTHDLQLARRLFSYVSKPVLYPVFMLEYPICVDGYLNQAMSNGMTILTSLQKLYGLKITHVELISRDQDNDHIFETVNVYRRDETLPSYGIDDKTATLTEVIPERDITLHLNPSVGKPLYEVGITAEKSYVSAPALLCSMCGVERHESYYYVGDSTVCKTCSDFLPGYVLYSEEKKTGPVSSLPKVKILTDRWIKNGKCSLCEEDAEGSCEIHYQWIKEGFVAQKFGFSKEGKNCDDTTITKCHSLTVVIWSGGKKSVQEPMHLFPYKQIRYELLRETMGLKDVLPKPSYSMIDVYDLRGIPIPSIGQMPALLKSEIVGFVTEAKKWYPHLPDAVILGVSIISSYDTRLFEYLVKNDTLVSRLTNPVGLTQEELDDLCFTLSNVPRQIPG